MLYTPIKIGHEDYQSKQNSNQQAQQQAVQQQPNYFQTSYQMSFSPAQQKQVQSQSSSQQNSRPQSRKQSNSNQIPSQYIYKSNEKQVPQSIGEQVKALKNQQIKTPSKASGPKSNYSGSTVRSNTSDLMCLNCINQDLTLQKSAEKACNQQYWLDQQKKKRDELAKYEKEQQDLLKDKQKWQDDEKNYLIQQIYEKKQREKAEKAFQQQGFPTSAQLYQDEIKLKQEQEQQKKSFISDLQKQIYEKEQMKQREKDFDKQFAASLNLTPQRLQASRYDLELANDLKKQIEDKQARQKMLQDQENAAFTEAKRKQELFALENEKEAKLQQEQQLKDFKDSLNKDVLDKQKKRQNLLMEKQREQDNLRSTQQQWEKALYENQQKQQESKNQFIRELQDQIKEKDYLKQQQRVLDASNPSLLAQWQKDKLYRCCNCHKKYQRFQLSQHKSPLKKKKNLI